MRSAAIILCSLIAIACAAAAIAQGRPRGEVSIAVTTASVRSTPGTRVDVLLLWNRDERIRPIGHGVKSCVKAGQGGIRGQGVMNCLLSLVLPLGKVEAAGIVHDVHRYTITIIGGTGAYEGVTGPLFVRNEAGDVVRRLTFNL